MTTFCHKIMPCPPSVRVCGPCMIEVYRQRQRTRRWWQRKGAFWSIHVSLELRGFRLRWSASPPLPSPQLGRSAHMEAASSARRWLSRRGCTRLEMSPTQTIRDRILSLCGILCGNRGVSRNPICPRVTRLRLVVEAPTIQPPKPNKSDAVNRSGLVVVSS